MIDSLFAYVFTDDDGVEKLVPTHHKELIMPAIVASLADANYVMPKISKMAQDSGKEIRLVSFSQPKVIEVIGFEKSKE